MSTDAGDNDEMVKLNVTVPKRLLKQIDELAEELNYTNRSESVREVLRDTTEPILTPGSQEGVSEGYADSQRCRQTRLGNASASAGTETERWLTMPF